MVFQESQFELPASHFCPERTFPLVIRPADLRRPLRTLLIRQVVDIFVKTHIQRIFVRHLRFPLLNPPAQSVASRGPTICVGLGYPLPFLLQHFTQQGSQTVVQAVIGGNIGGRHFILRFPNLG